MSPTVDPIPKEARPYQGRRAGIVSRSLAAGIDAFVVVLTMVAGYLGISLVVFVVPGGRVAADLPPLFTSLVITYVVSVLYLAVAWRAGGRTLGYHIMGLRLVSMRGTNGLLPVLLLRGAFCTLFPVGLAWVLFSGANRALWDVVLRTSVIHDWRMQPRAVREPTTPLALE